MGRSQQSFNKSEREKKRLKKREEKRKKMEVRKLDKESNGTQGIQMAYVDQFGNLTDTPPDPANKVKVKAKSIEISIPKQEKTTERFDPVHTGKVSYFDSSKGYGFIVDAVTNEKHFTHVSNIEHEISENDAVTFELAKGKRGMDAIKVKLA